MTFETISQEDEANRLSRVVRPKNELIQLYQKNYTYQFNYSICNSSCSESVVEFLYADFSADIDTTGSAYPLIDTKGRDICPIHVCKTQKGCFTVNGWGVIQFLLR